MGSIIGRLFRSVNLINYVYLEYNPKLTHGKRVSGKIKRSKIKYTSILGAIYGLRISKECQSKDQLSST